MYGSGESIEDTSAVAVKDAANDSNISPAIADKLVEPLVNLRRAANEKKVERICAAYLALRRAAGVNRREAFALADTVLGQPTMNLVVSAYSHRHCFMCDGGTVLCEECDQIGTLADGKACVSCEGLGVVECSFCGGTGWADRNTVPAEIAPAVLNRQFCHVKVVLRRTIGALAGFTIRQIRSLPPRKRTPVVAKLMQLHWRLGDLVCSSCIDDDKERVRLEAVADKIRVALEMLKEH